MIHWSWMLAPTVLLLICGALCGYLFDSLQCRERVIAARDRYIHVLQVMVRQAMFRAVELEAAALEAAERKEEDRDAADQ